MERSSNVNLKFIADKLTTELTGTLSYIVTDDVQYFNNIITDGGNKYVPVVITNVLDYAEYSKQLYNETYNLKFHVLEDDRDLFIADIKTFVDAQQTETIDTYFVQKLYQSLRMTGEQTLNGVDYFIFDMQTTWTYALGLIGGAATLEIDSVVVPYRNWEIMHDIAFVSNQTRLSNYRMTNDTVRLEIPLILSNTKIQEIYDEVNTDYYNKQYVVKLHDKTKTLALKQSIIRVDVNTGLATMVLTLETYYPRVTITIDGTSVPITAYRYMMKKTMDTARRKDTVSSDLIKGYSTGKSRTFALTIGKDSSALYQKIVNDVYGDDLNITYTLVRDGRTFTLEIAEATESYTETGDMAIEIQGVEYGS